MKNHNHRNQQRRTEGKPPTAHALLLLCVEGLGAWFIIAGLSADDHKEMMIGLVIGVIILITAACTWIFSSRKKPEPPPPMHKNDDMHQHGNKH